MSRLPPGMDPERIKALSPSETTPLWLEASRAQAERRRPADVLRRFEDDELVAPSPMDLRISQRLDALALGAARDYEALLLSPVAPLGCCSALAPTSQDRTLSAARGVEVVSDPTNVLALEASRRLKRRPDEVVRLCTVQQILRAQPPPPGKGFTRHFRLFATAEAGRARPDDGFEVDAVARAFGVFDELFDAVEDGGIRVPERNATIYRTAEAETLAARVRARLEEGHPDVRFDEEVLENSYYAGLRVLFGGRAVDGDRPPVADLGCFDWVGQLTSNHRNRLVAAGCGLQLLHLAFGGSGRSDRQ